MSEKLPVIVAIPNYNTVGNMATLLPQVLAQRYDKVYVLDDASKVVPGNSSSASMATA